MSAVHIVALGDGELIDFGHITMEILEDGSNTGHRLGAVRSAVPPKTVGPPQHKHLEHDEGFLVTKGTIVFTVGAESYHAPAGTFVMVPVGVPHTFNNPFDEPAEFVGTVTPDFYIQYFRDLATAAQNGKLNPAHIKELMARYATETV